jgi:hypothetical protein
MEQEQREKAEPTEQPFDPRGRLMLNEYGRQCWVSGYETAKAEVASLQAERASARIWERTTFAQSPNG